MERLELLISGAGIGGCTLAHWLTRSGHSAVVERGGALRSSGSPVDVRGPAVDVAERMNIATRLREASIRLKGMTLLDSGGRRVARVDIAALRSSIVPKGMELDAVRVARDMYFDSVARVDVAKWARGRIALLGDASSCVSLFGDGSTLAIAGAYELAKALKESPTDPQGALGMHGGPSPGAPKGNQNAFKHGCCSAASIAERRRFAELLREMREITTRADKNNPHNGRRS
jgi:2-polyprenyl-6-methoxyphenol hydroxylase-like FAD-dependent oxidoreductase